METEGNGDRPAREGGPVGVGIGIDSFHWGSPLRKRKTPRSGRERGVLFRVFLDLTVSQSRAPLPVGRQ